MNTMSYNEVKQYLEDFYEGKSTIEQENALKKYFNAGSIDPDFAQDKILFADFLGNESESQPPSLAHQLLLVVKQPSRKRLSVKFYTTIAGLAASLAILFGVYALSEYKNNIASKELAAVDTYEDPQEAYEATKSVLMLLSTGMANGKKELSMLNKVAVAQNTIGAVNSINQEISYLSSLSAFNSSVSKLSKYTAYFSYFSHEEVEKESKE